MSLTKSCVSLSEWTTALTFENLRQINIRDKQRKDTLTVEVFDKDVIGKDDSLGKFAIPLPSLRLLSAATTDAETKWHSFDPEPGAGNKENKGQVQMRHPLVSFSTAYYCTHPALLLLYYRCRCGISLSNEMPDKDRVARRERTRNFVRLL